MAKEFNVDLKSLVDQYRQNTSRGSVIMSSASCGHLPTSSPRATRGRPRSRRRKRRSRRGLAAFREPTEAEMKRAAADEEAAKLARMRGIGDDYTSNAEPDVPQSDKDARMERQFQEFRGDSRAGENVPGRPFRGMWRRSR